MEPKEKNHTSKDRKETEERAFYPERTCVKEIAGQK